MGSYGDLRSISGYTESLGESAGFQRLLKQSLMISTSAEGLNVFVFVFSNYIGNFYLSQAFLGACRARQREMLKAFMFIKTFPANRIPIQSL